MPEQGKYKKILSEQLANEQLARDREKSANARGWPVIEYPFDLPAKWAREKEEREGRKRQWAIQDRERQRKVQVIHNTVARLDIVSSISTLQQELSLPGSIKEEWIDPYTNPVYAISIRTLTRKRGRKLYEWYHEGWTGPDPRGGSGYKTYKRRGRCVGQVINETDHHLLGFRVQANGEVLLVGDFSRTRSLIDKRPDPPPPLKELKQIFVGPPDSVDRVARADEPFSVLSGGPTQLLDATSIDAFDQSIVAQLREWDMMTL